MPGPDKKQTEDAKKAIQGEVKKLAKKAKKQTEEAKKLLEEKEQAQKDKARDKVKEADLKLKKIEKELNDEGAATAKRISLAIKDYIPEDKKDLPAWQKGMDKWYIDYLKKEPGLDVGGGKKLGGSFSVKDKKIEINIGWKFD